MTPEIGFDEPETPEDLLNRAIVQMHYLDSRCEALETENKALRHVASVELNRAVERWRAQGEEPE